MNSFAKTTATFIAEQSNKELWICDENLFPPDEEKARGQNIKGGEEDFSKRSAENLVISDIEGENDKTEVDHMSADYLKEITETEQLLAKRRHEIECSEEELPLTDDEQLYLKKILQCSSSGDQSAKVDDLSSFYISKASGEGYLHTEEEKKALQQIDDKLKSLLTSEEYKKLNLDKEFDLTGENVDHAGDTEETLSDINKKLEDLNKKFNQSMLSEEEINTLIGDSAEQLEEVKSQGKNLPAISEELIKKMVDEIESDKTADEVQGDRKVVDEAQNESEVQGKKVVKEVQDVQPNDEVQGEKPSEDAQDDKPDETQAEMDRVLNPFV